MFFFARNLRENYDSGTSVRIVLTYHCEEIIPTGRGGMKRNKRFSFTTWGFPPTQVLDYISHFFWATIAKCRQHNYMLTRFTLDELTPLGHRIRGQDSSSEEL